MSGKHSVSYRKRPIHEVAEDYNDEGIDEFIDVSSSIDTTVPRKGKWTHEEESYANKMIEFFNKGFLKIPAGTTLRAYLSEKLHCDPMRITKKYTGASCIGKQVYALSRYIEGLDEILETSEIELKHLEQEFLSRLAHKGKTYQSVKPFEETQQILNQPIQLMKTNEVDSSAHFDYFSFDKDINNYEFGNISSRNSFTVSELETRSEKIEQSFTQPTATPSLKKRVTSAPNLQQLVTPHPSSTGLSKIPRSQSLVNFDNCELDVVAAGDLLMSFSDSVLHNFTTQQEQAYRISYPKDDVMKFLDQSSQQHLYRDLDHDRDPPPSNIGGGAQALPSCTVMGSRQGVVLGGGGYTNKMMERHGNGYLQNFQFQRPVSGLQDQQQSSSPTYLNKSGIIQQTVLRSHITPNVASNHWVDGNRDSYEENTIDHQEEKAARQRDTSAVEGIQTGGDSTEHLNDYQLSFSLHGDSNSGGGYPADQSSSFILGVDEQIDDACW